MGFVKGLVNKAADAVGLGGVAKGIEGALGMGNGGQGQGTNFNATGANILQPTDLNQISGIYGNATSGINQQQALVDALRNQGGIGNQSSVFNQQQNLANQIQGVANGTGPNPALAQLANATGQNVAQQAAMMAGQRGAGANAGLLARQAAMQGGNIQQQAAGQAAALQAQQQLNAMGALQQQQGMMGNLAGQQVGQQSNALGFYNQAAQSEQGNLLGALKNYNDQNVAMQSNLNNVNAGIQGKVADNQSNLAGGLLGGLGTVGTAIGGMFGGSKPAAAPHTEFTSSSGSVQNAAHGGMIKSYADGGAVTPGGPSSLAGRFLFSSAPDLNAQSAMSPVSQIGSPIGQSMASGAKSAGNALGDLAGKGLKAGLSWITGGFLSEGGSVPGESQVAGDSIKNDKVPAMLSPGEIVIPRHIVNSNNPSENAAKFVASVMARNKMGR